MVGGIAIDFVGGHVDEGGFGAGLPRGFEEVECADGIGVKVVEGDACGEVVRGLGGCVYDGIGFYFGQEFANAHAVSDVYFVVVEVFQDAVEAWMYGPVIRAVYHALKNYGAKKILKPILEREERFDERAESLIRIVWERYGQIDGLTLSRMTHAPGLPWDQTQQRAAHTQIIHEHVIRDYYADIVKEQTK